MQKLEGVADDRIIAKKNWQAQSKIKDLREYIDENELDTEINCDGGINSDTILKVKDAGAETAVVGSAMINAIDYKYMMNKLKNT